MSQQVVIALMLGAAFVASLPGLLAFRRLKQQPRAKFNNEQAGLIKQMQEQVDAQQQTIRFLHKRVDELEKSRAREFAETEILRQEIEDLRQEVGELLRGVTVLTGQLQSADIAPAWSPMVKRPPAKRNHDQAIDFIALRQRLIDQFSLEEIDDLAFQLEIGVDDLSGTTKRKKARSLINYLKDRARLHELSELIRSLRPEGDN